MNGKTVLVSFHTKWHFLIVALPDKFACPWGVRMNMFQQNLDNLTKQAGISFGIVAAFARALFALFIANGETHLTIAILLARIVDIWKIIFHKDSTAPDKKDKIHQVHQDCSLLHLSLGGIPQCRCICCFRM